MDQRIATVDTRVDAFEARVQKRLDGAQSIDMSAFQQKLAKFKADLIASLAAPITAPEQAPASKDLIDLFALDNPPRAPRKRPIEETESKAGHKWQWTFEKNEEQITEFVL